MLFTLYYVAATWIQSWRLNHLKSRIHEYLVRNGSVVLYQVPEVDISSDVTAEGGFCVQVPSVSSSYCVNKSDAKLGDLLWNIGNKRVYSLFPQQKIDLSQWISFQDRGVSMFPITSNVDVKTELDPESKVEMLIEAEFSIGHTKDGEFTKIDSFGILKAWKASANFGMILETDVEHLARLGLCFLFGNPNIQDGMEIVRLETVSCSGQPCRLINSDTIPIPRTVRQQSTTLGDDASWEDVDEHMTVSSFMGDPVMSPMQWKTHVELLQNFSQAAEEMPSGEITIAPDRTISAMPTTSTPKRPDPSEALKDSLKALYNFKMDEEEIRLEVLKGSASTASAKSGSPKGMASSQASSKGSTSAPDDESYLTRKHPAPELPQGSSPQHGKKPPNILILCLSSQDVATQSKEALEAALQKHKYVIYSTSPAEVSSNAPWADNTSMLYTHGRLGSDMVKPILNYVMSSGGGAEGGVVFCMCPGAEFLKMLLPCTAFNNAKDSLEAKGSLSYKQWKGLKLPHCAVGVRASDIPPSVDVTTTQGKASLSLKVLGSEDNSHEPALMLVSHQGGNGKILVSLVKLIASAGESEQRGLEIMSDLFSLQLGLSVTSVPSVPSSVSSSPSVKSSQQTTLTNGYFLGRHEHKLEFLSQIKDHMKDNLLTINSGYSIKFCQNANDIPKSGATSSFLPVLLHTCPPKFSTVEYFENLQSESIGRLVIYSRMMTSTMAVLSGPFLRHGLAVIAGQQTEGKGRGSNVWLSPEGCAMFSLQLVFADTSYLGRHAPLLQHIVALAVVSAIHAIQGCEELDLRLKWPNDIYSGATDKIGGVIVNSTSTRSSLICNVGCGLNISNSVPTICVNDLIREHNKKKGIVVGNKDSKGVASLTIEKFLAQTFTQLEKLIDAAQNEKIDKVMKLYYDYWLHSNAEVQVTFPSGQTQQGKITGIDDFGFLQVKPSGSTSAFTVHPDGNSFDMLKGLILPKK